MELSVKGLNRSRRIGKSNFENKRRPIIVKFIEIFNNKK